jgi:hypothetical protein
MIMYCLNNYHLCDLFMKLFLNYEVILYDC